MSELNNAFLNNGMEALMTFDTAMKEANYHYSLAFGTMLGAVREHGFIKHDFDIDVFMWIEDLDELLPSVLKKSGFKYTHTFLVDNGKLGREDTIEYKGVQIDIFYIYPALSGREYAYCCDFLPYGNCRSWNQSIRKHGGLLPRRFEIPTSKKLTTVPFETMQLPIMDNADEFLSFRYGPDYMTPKPSWRNGDNPYIVPWVEKLASFIEF